MEEKQSVESKTSEELGLMLNAQYNEIIRIQSNIRIINIELEKRMKPKEE